MGSGESDATLKVQGLVSKREAGFQPSLPGSVGCPGGGLICITLCGSLGDNPGSKEAEWVPQGTRATSGGGGILYFCRLTSQSL